MKVSFKKIHIENFLSFGVADFVIDNSGYVLVSGRNSNAKDSATSNGSGKSALFDSILWCLTGETIRGSKDVVNLFGNDGTLVELTFSLDKDEFVVTRTKNHSKYKSNLFVYRNNNNVSGKGIRDTEKILEDYLGELTPSIISSVIILGQGLPQRFTNNTPSARKEILEKLSKSDFMVEDLKSRVSRRKNEILSSKRELEDTRLTQETTLRLKKADLQQILDHPVSTEKIEQLEQDIQDLKNRINDLIIEKDIINSEALSKELELDIIQQKYDGITKAYYSKINKLDNDYHENIAAFNQEKFNLEQEYKSATNEINKIDNMKDTCPTCGQKLVDFVRPDKTPFIEQQERASRYLTTIKEDIDNITSSYQEEKSKVDSIYKDETADIIAKQAELKKAVRELSDKVSDINIKIKNAEVSQSTSETTLRSLKENISTREDTIKSLSSEIEKIENNLLYINNGVDEITERLSIVNNMETVLKRDFRGILLESVINYIDSRAKEYASVVFGSENISFQLDGNAISIKLNDKEYENLSGGEKQKVDLIIQFAIRSMLVMQTGFNCNIIVLDEIFDNLDNIGSERVLDLISAKLNDVENIFVVTHHSSIPIPYDKEVIIQKGDDNLSVIV